jgi:hypothetical protein
VNGTTRWLPQGVTSTRTPTDGVPKGPVMTELVVVAVFVAVGAVILLIARGVERL